MTTCKRCGEWPAVFCITCQGDLPHAPVPGPGTGAAWDLAEGADRELLAAPFFTAQDCRSMARALGAQATAVIEAAKQLAVTERARGYVAASIVEARLRELARKAWRLAGEEEARAAIAKAKAETA